jgi:phage gp36-like protein
MAYATLQDVNALIPKAFQFTPTSQVTDAVVTSHLDDVSNEIDMSLGHIYIVPVTNAPKALQFLKNLCSWGALGRAQEGRNTGSVPEAAGIKSVWTKKYEENLAWLVDQAEKSGPLGIREFFDAQVNSDHVPKVASQIVTSYQFSEGDPNNLDLDDVRLSMNDTY